MSTVFNNNFENLVKHCLKAASLENDCPIDKMVLGAFIGYMFDDQENVNKILPKYLENLEKMDKFYGESNKTVEDVIASKDRSIFSHMQFFPSELLSKYDNHIRWFSTFLQNRMAESRMDHVWKVMTKLTKQARKLKTNCVE